MNVSLITRKFVLKCFLIGIAFQCCLVSAKAQTFEWAVQAPGTDITVYPNGGGNKVATDQEGNVYFAGAFYGPRDFDTSAGSAILTPIKKDYAAVYLAKYDGAGKYQWAKCILNVADHRGVVYDVVVDKQGRVAVVGNFGGMAYYQNARGIDSIDSPWGTYLTQYDRDGNFLWIKATKALGADSIMGGCVPIGGMSVDGEDNIYVAGYFFYAPIDFDPGSGRAILTPVNSSSSNITNAFIAKYDAGGTCTWVRGICGDSLVQSAFYAQGFGVAVDKQGCAYLAGVFDGTIDFDPGPGVFNRTSMGDADIAIVKLDKDGLFQWAKRMGGSSFESCYGIEIGGLGGIYIGGLTMSNDADFDPGPGIAILTSVPGYKSYIACYDTDGNYHWAHSIGAGGGALHPIQGSITADSLDNIYITEGFFGADINLNPNNNSDTSAKAIVKFSPGNVNGFIAKYEPACGSFVAGFKIGAAGIYPNGVAVCTAKNGTIDAYVFGNLLESSIDFDPGPDSFILSLPEDNTDFDVFLVKVNFADTSSIVKVDIAACGEQYVWNDSIYTASGRYLHVIPLEGGCDSIVLLDLILSTIEKPFITVKEFELGVTAAYDNYQWIKNDKLISGATEATYIVTENADYRVIVGNGKGCRDTSDVYHVTNYTSIDRIGDRENLSIYPNPAGNRVYISSLQAVNIKLTDIGGRVLQEEQEVQSFSVKGLAEGMYLLHIQDSKGRLLKMEKLLKVN